MRYLILTSLVCFCAPTARAADPEAERLDALLKALEDRMKTIDTFQATCIRDDVHPLTKKAIRYTGEITWQKPNRAKLDLTYSEEVGKKDAEKTQFERYICDGRRIYEYCPREKLIVEHAMPKDDSAINGVFFVLMKGMKAADLKKQFEIEFSRKDEEYYSFVRFIPKNNADKQDFKMAELTIYRKHPTQGLAHVPCMIRYIQPNGRELKYTFTDIKPNVKLPENAFTAYGITGYKSERAQASRKSP